MLTRYRRWLYLCSAVYLCFAAVTLCRAVDRPFYNWDILPYHGVAIGYFESDPAAVHAQTLEAFRKGVRPTLHKSLLEPHKPGSYRNTVAADPEAFRQQLPFYAVKPLYAGLMAALHGLGISLVDASVWISITGFAFLLVVLWYWIPPGVDPGLWRLAIPAFFSIAAYPIANLAFLSTPDALSVFLLTAGCFLICNFHNGISENSTDNHYSPLAGESNPRCGFGGGKAKSSQSLPPRLSSAPTGAGFVCSPVKGERLLKNWRHPFAFTLLLLSIAARPDNVIFVLMLAAYLAVLAPTPHKLSFRTAAVIGGAALLLYFFINHFAGSYGWAVLFHHSFIKLSAYPATLEPAISFSDYRRELLQGAMFVWERSPREWMLLAAGILTTLLYGKPEGTTAKLWYGLVFLAWTNMLIRFLLFPNTTERYFYFNYILLLYGLFTLWRPVIMQKEKTSA